MRHAVRIALVVVIVGGLCESAFAQQIRIATLAPQGSTWMNILDQAGLDIDAATNSRVTIKYYANGVQGDETDVVSKMTLGQLDGGSLTLAGLAEIDPHISVLELPMLFQNEAEADYVIARMWPYFQKRFEKKGYILGPYATVGWNRLLTSRRATSVNDLRTEKLWGWPTNAGMNELYRELNIRTVPLSVTTVLSGLMSGRISACYTSPLAAVALQWNTKVQYMSSMAVSLSLGATVIRDSVWNQVSQTDQASIEQIANAAAKQLRAMNAKQNARAESVMIRKGIQLVKTPAAMTADFENAAQRVQTNLSGVTFTAAELKLVLKFRAAAGSRSSSSAKYGSGTSGSARSGSTTSGSTTSGSTTSGSGTSGKGTSGGSTSGDGGSDEPVERNYDYDYDNY